jgi:hypothetical protein
MSTFVCRSPLGKTQHVDIPSDKGYDNIVRKHLSSFGFSDINDAAFEKRMGKIDFILAINVLEKSKYIKLHGSE